MKTALLLSTAIAAANLHLLRAWARKTGDYTDPICRPDPPDHGHEELDAAGNPDTTGPPGT